MMAKAYFECDPTRNNSCIVRMCMAGQERCYTQFPRYGSNPVPHVPVAEPTPHGATKLNYWPLPSDRAEAAVLHEIVTKYKGGWLARDKDNTLAFFISSRAPIETTHSWVAFDGEKVRLTQNCFLSVKPMVCVPLARIDTAAVVYYMKGR